MGSKELRDISEINKDIETIAASLGLLDKRLVNAKTPAEIEAYTKLIKEFEKIFHELEAEKLKASEGN
ncbi:hypothetical protein ACFLYU_02255 [Candidatus Dependentiae bacterium]